MFILEIILLILDILTIYLLIKEIKKRHYKFENNFNEKYNKINPQNKILFYKLKKQYLNNISNEDIKELQIFLDSVLRERK